MPSFHDKKKKKKHLFYALQISGPNPLRALGTIYVISESLNASNTNLIAVFGAACCPATVF